MASAAMRRTPVAPWAPSRPHGPCRARAWPPLPFVSAPSRYAMATVRTDQAPHPMSMPRTRMQQEALRCRTAKPRPIGRMAQPGRLSMQPKQASNSATQPPRAGFQWQNCHVRMWVLACHRKHADAAPNAAPSCSALAMAGRWAGIHVQNTALHGRIANADIRDGCHLAMPWHVCRARTGAHRSAGPAGAILPKLGIGPLFATSLY